MCFIHGFTFHKGHKLYSNIPKMHSLSRMFFFLLSVFHRVPSNPIIVKQSRRLKLSALRFVPIRFEIDRFTGRVGFVQLAQTNCLNWWISVKHKFDTNIREWVCDLTIFPQIIRPTPPTLTTFPIPPILHRHYRLKLSTPSFTFNKSKWNFIFS